MKKSLIFVMFLLAVLIFSESAHAVDYCTASEVDKIRVVSFKDGCGSYLQACIYHQAVVCNGRTECQNRPAYYAWGDLNPNSGSLYSNSLNLASGLTNYTSIQMRYSSFSGKYSPSTLPFNAICTANSAGDNACCATPCGTYIHPDVKGYNLSIYVEDGCTKCNDQAQSSSAEDYTPCMYGNKFCYSISGGNADKGVICLPGESSVSYSYYYPSKSKNVCYTGKCTSTDITYVDNNKGINVSDRSSQLTVNISAHCNIPLTGLYLEICKEDCFNETIKIDGTDYDQELSISNDMLRWIDGKTSASSDFNFKITASNAVSISQQISAFNLFGEDTPQISVSDVPASIGFGSKIKIDARVVERLSGIKKFEIYTDNALKNSCDSETCSYEYVPAEGSHTYRIYVEDKVGHENSKEGSFEISTTQKSCSEIGGVSCGADERCTNEQSVEISGEKCCTSSCYSSELNLTCAAQEGIIYDPSMKDCSSEIPATDTVSPNACCAVQPTEKPIISGEKLLFWQDSIGNHIFGTGLQENVKCIAVGDVQKIQISKDGNVKIQKDDDLVSIKVEEVGTYVCKAFFRDGSEKEASLKIMEAPAPGSLIRARLPGFGIVQLIITLCLMGGYYAFRRK